MKRRIVFISSHQLYQPTCDALERLNLDCDAIVAPYNNFEHISKVYRQYADTADTFLVSGPSAKRAIELSCNTSQKIIDFYKVDSAALFRDILTLAVENRDQDFSRVAMDFLVPLECGYSVKDFLAMDDIEAVDTAIQDWMIKTGIREVGGAEDAIMDRIQELWNQKAIDLVICEYSSIAPLLEELKIPYRCPFPSDAYLSNLIREILVRTELKNLQDNLPAIIQIVPDSSQKPTAEMLAQLRQHVNRFVQDNLIDCVEQESPHALTLITTLQVVRFLTKDFQVCRFSAYLQSVLDFPIVLAYGIGANLSHATTNVQIATREAKITGKSYMMDNNGNLIGPLNSENRMVIDTNSLSSVTVLSKRCKLAPMTLQKLMVFMDSLGTNNITTQELAQRFGITIRNANRILTNLCKGGVATPVYTQTSHSRGRPVQVYNINFDIK